MNRVALIAVALATVTAVMVSGVAVAQPAEPTVTTNGNGIVAQAAENATTTNETNATPENVSPGARLGGVMQVGQAELENEVEHRAFGKQVSQAATENDTAEVLALTQTNLEQRLEHMNERLEALEQAREDGNISEEAYQAQASGLNARITHVENMAESANATAGTIPSDVLERNGVNVTAIETLRNDARNMSGQEVATIARTIGGPNVGERMGPPEGVPGEPPEWAGPPSAGERGHGQMGQGDMGPGANETERGPGNMTVGNDSERDRDTMGQSGTTEGASEATTGSSTEQETTTAGAETGETENSSPTETSADDS